MVTRILTTLLCTLAASAHAVELRPATVGEAFDLTSEQPLYTETHCVSEDGLQREVIYRDVRSEVIAHKTLDYSTGLTTPSFTQHDFQSGEAVKVLIKPEVVEIAINEDGAGQPATRASLSRSADSPLVVDAGFDAFVKQNLARLEQGEPLQFQFPFAAREQLFDLRIERTDCSYASEEHQCFRLEIDNWLLKLLAAPIELGYDRQHQRLARFRGLSNIGDGNGNGLEVDIHYRYEGIPADACTLADAAIEPEPTPVSTVLPALPPATKVFQL